MAAAGRIAIRLAIWRRLFLDDCALLLALACLAAATGMLYKFGWLVYVLNVMKYDRAVRPTAADLDQIMHAQAINYSLVALMWSAIYPVKACFLLTFRGLIANVSRAILVWYWAAVVLITVFWGLMVGLSWIECPYTGPALRRLLLLLLLSRGRRRGKENRS